MDICSQFVSMETIGDAYLIHTNNADIKICFLTDEIIRIWASFEKVFMDESYILMTTAWPDRLDSLFQGQRKTIAPWIPTIKDTNTSLYFSTSKVTLVIEKAPLNIKLLSSKGIELYSTLAGNPFTQASSGRITAYSSIDEDDCFYGFGEKTGSINKNNQFLRERATDAMGYDPQHADTLYKHIPFYIRLNRSSKKAVGIFYHNFFESEFNMGCEKSNYWPRYSYWQASGGDIDLFLLGGESIARVIDNYTLLTGRPALLPKRALGYQGSSMYYPELPKDSDDAVLGFVDNVTKEGFPIDGFHLSSGYTSQHNKRCVFTWNTTRFKEPSTFFHTMKERHATVVPNVKPGVLLCHPLLEEFNSKEVFIKDSKNPSMNAIGKWWGGNGVFWDFTNSQARDVWKQYLTKSIISLGTDSIWNDNCEYDSLLDEDSICSFDGKSGTLSRLKPIMSTLMCKLGMEAILEYNDHIRPYIVCRSGSAGIQHYAQTWCGDNYTSWETLKYNIPTILGMGLSGQPNEGGDVGGFAGPAPNEELFVRWVQHGIFQPRFSIHSASNDNTVTEPWMFTNVTPLIRDAILLRYQFTPYLYSAEYTAHETGTPIMRPLVYEFQDDPNVYNESFKFMFGRDLLIANVLEPGAIEQQVYLPAGCKWYDWNDHYRCYNGGQTIKIPVQLSTIPMFIRDGAMIAMAQNQLMSMETDHTTAMTLIVAPNGINQTLIYDDDGVTNNYQSDVYHKTWITTTNGQRVTMHVSYEGSYQDWIDTIHVDMIAKEKAPLDVFMKNHRLTHFFTRDQFMASQEGWYYSQTKRSVEIKYQNPKTEYTLTVSFEQFDLIGMDE